MGQRSMFFDSNSSHGMLLGLVALLVIPSLSIHIASSKSNAQELIAPGTPFIEQSDRDSSPPNAGLQTNPFAKHEAELPAPKPVTPQPSRPMARTPELSLQQLPDDPGLGVEPVDKPVKQTTVDPLEEYRRTLEEHILRKERAKLEARARFEARSLDRIPKLTPTQTSPSSANPSTEKNATPPNASGSTKSPPEESAIQSPSDLKLSAPSDDDLLPAPKLTPPKSKDRARSKPQTDRNLDELLAPLRSSVPPRSLDRKIPEPLGAQPKTTKGRPERLGGATMDSLAETDDRDDQRDQPEVAKSGSTEDDDQASTRDKDDQSRTSQSVLGNMPLPARDAPHHWTGLVENEMSRWPQPASFRPAGPISHVQCSSCGGCVDRSGHGFIDKRGVCLGVGTRERKICQCWRCPNNPPFNLYGPGGYAGPARSAPMYEYRLRNGDLVQLTFLIKTVRTTGAYRLVVGDELLVESEADEKLTRGTLERGLEIQPDGTITLRFIGQVHAAGQTIEQLRVLLNERYEEYYPDPSIDVTPVLTNNVARQIREAISGSEGFNPQQTLQRVTPEGTLRLPRLGAIPTQGLTLAELKREINLRYETIGAGLEVEVVLEEQAPHYIYVVGEVNEPGRFEIDAPTTVLGSLALAGSYIPGANLRQVVVFRRGPNWELLSTMLDLRGALLAKASRPSDEIWLQDGDVVIVPPAPIALFDRFVRQVFTEGVYGIVPFSGFGFSFGNNN